MTEKSVQGAVDTATDNHAFEMAARGGYAVSGVLHLLVAYLIVRIAIGSGGNADQSGALSALAGTTGGAIMLWVAAVALIGMAVWRLAEVVVGPHPSEEGDEKEGAKLALARAKAVALAVVYFALAFSAIKFATGSGQSSGQQNAGLSARLMQSGWGKTLLVVAGLVIIGVGCYHIYKGVSKRFLKDLRVSGGRVITPLGIVGYVAKGLALAGAGVLVIVASATSDPSKATGVDGAVKTLGEAPFGKILLIVAALGIAAYGAFCFVQSRFSRM